jgi:hypothetical protein
MRTKIGRLSGPLLAGVVAGGLVAAGLFLTAMHLFGFNAICAQGVLCELAGYRNVGAARGVHLVGTVDPHTEFAVVWESPGRQRPPTVRHRPAGAGEWSIAEGSSRPAPANGVVASGSHIHQVRVTGLQPGTRYEYQVSWDARSGHREFSPTFNARTLTANAPIKLAFLADTCLSNRPDGRSGPMSAVMGHLAESGVQLILGGGDYACAIDDGRYATAEPAIQRFFDEWQPLLASVPLVAQYGNHECCHGENADLWSPRLDLSWAPWRSEDGRSFAFDLLDTFIVGFYGTGAEPEAARSHLEWLDRMLGQARARGQRHLVVFQHAPLFSAGLTHPPHEALRRQIVPILERWQVNLHLSAHDMSYERTLPLADGAEGDPTIGSLPAAPGDDWSGVVYAKVSPAGRATSRHDNLPDQLPPYIAVADEGRFYYATLTIPGGGAPLKYAAQAFTPHGDGTVVDSFLLGR